MARLPPGECQEFCVSGLCDGGSLDGFGISRTTAELLVANEGRAASPVKAAAQGGGLQGLLVGHTRATEVDG